MEVITFLVFRACCFFVFLFHFFHLILHLEERSIKIKESKPGYHTTNEEQEQHRVFDPDKDNNRATEQGRKYTERSNERQQDRIFDQLSDGHMIMSNHREKVKHGYEQNNHENKHDNAYNLQIVELRHIHGIIHIHNDKQQRVKDASDQALLVVFLVSFKKRYETHLHPYRPLPICERR